MSRSGRSGRQSPATHLAHEWHNASPPPPRLRNGQGPGSRFTAGDLGLCRANCWWTRTVRNRRHLLCPLYALRVVQSRSAGARRSPLRCPHGWSRGDTCCPRRWRTAPDRSAIETTTETGARTPPQAVRTGADGRSRAPLRVPRLSSLVTNGRCRSLSGWPRHGPNMASASRQGDAVAHDGLKDAHRTAHLQQTFHSGDDFR